MSKATPLFVRSSTAARMLDMPASEFRHLVASGALPPPVRIGSHERWHVAQLEAIVRGEAALPDEEFDL
jgi:predicted DNA-binding transcriptional regulator AlpA